MKKAWELALLAAAILVVAGSLVLTVKRHEFAAWRIERRVLRELLARNPDWRFEPEDSGIVAGANGLALRLEGTGLHEVAVLTDYDFSSVVLIGLAVEKLDFLRNSDSLKQFGAAELSRLRDASALAGRPLIQLALMGSPVEDASFLATLPELEKLTFSRNPELRDLTPVANCRRLKWLNLSGCTGVTDLSPLAGLEQLADLDLSGTGVTDLSPLVGLKLHSLNIADTPAAERPLPKDLVVGSQIQR